MVKRRPDTVPDMEPVMQVFEWDAIPIEDRERQPVFFQEVKSTRCCFECALDWRGSIEIRYAQFSAHIAQIIGFEITDDRQVLLIL